MVPRNSLAFCACVLAASPPRKNPLPVSLPEAIAPSCVEANHPSTPSGSLLENACDATFCARSGANCNAAKPHRVAAFAGS